ncbi:WYL domain-containing protein [Treponema primitia]|uniref:helix-turn-helix transcriptional regulator n=1 Tax=Treponema primitia TaxID=88058 RepID=UPI00397F6BD4
MKNQKTLPKTALPRIYLIDKEISTGKYPNTKTLSQKYETGTATISRDIEFMRDRLGAPIEYDYFERGYYYTEKTFRLPAAFTSAEDMLALGMAKTLLSLYRNTPIYEAVHQLVETITAPLDDPGKTRWYEDRIVVPPVPTVQFKPEVWQNIVEALGKNHILRFEYRRSWYSAWQVRRVRPYQLLFDNGAWYLYGYAEDRRGMGMYSLSRIRTITLLNDIFTLPASFDIRTKNKGSYFGAYSSEKKQRFRINFYGEAALRIQERQWAEDQRIEESADGITLSFTSAQYGKILELVLSSGRDALPLEPQELVDDWLGNVRDMAKRAKGVAR